MQPKEWLDSRKGKLIAIAVVALFVIGGLYFILRGGEEKRGPSYDPEIELPSDYGLLMDAPIDNGSMMFSAMLSSLAVDSDGNYHPMFILGEDGSLDEHQIDTIDKMGLGSYEFLLFTKDPESPPSAANQVNIFGTYDMDPMALADFKGFDGLMTVASYKEALWASSIAQRKNLVEILF